MRKKEERASEDRGERARATKRGERIGWHERQIEVV